MHCMRPMSVHYMNIYKYVLHKHVSLIHMTFIRISFNKNYVEASRSHSDTPHSVKFSWTSDQSDAETSTDIHTPGGIRTRSPSKRAALYPRLRPRSHWDRQRDYANIKYLCVLCLQLCTVLVQNTFDKKTRKILNVYDIQNIYPSPLNIQPCVFCTKHMHYKCKRHFSSRVNCVLVLKWVSWELHKMPMSADHWCFRPSAVVSRTVIQNMAYWLLTSDSLSQL